MANTVRKFWDYIVAHNVWSKVAAWAIYTAIGGVCLFAYTHFNNVSFLGTLGSFFVLKIPLWACLLSIILAVALSVRFRKKRNKKDTERMPSEVYPATNIASIKANLQGVSQTLNNLIFDSNISDQSWWNGYGQQNWDETKKQLVGDRGVGDWHFREHILTVARDNTAGRFVIAIRTYLSNGGVANFIPANLTGKNPRNIRVKFSARVFSGKHKVAIVFRQKDVPTWINKVEFEISNANWEPLLTGMAIKADEDFLIELHTWSIETKTRFQIKDFIVEET